MSFLEIFTLLTSDVTIFGVVVGVFSVYNGRMTRREIGGLIRETRELIAREAEASRQFIQETRELMARGTERTQELIARTQELIAREEEATRQLIRETREATLPILQGITEILGRIDERVR